MENASKALIIAASILLALLIIAMGVTIFNQAQSAADTSTLDSTEISMFNSKFERYDGNQLGSQVKSLISSLISNASTNADDPSKLPTVVYIDDEGDEQTATESDITTLGNIRSDIVSTHTYDVTLDYGGSGLIATITITY